MKKVILATSGSNDSIMTSSNGNFELVSVEGTTINNIPWSGYSVISRNLADKHVIRIHIDWKNENYDGTPIVKKPMRCYVSHGMRSSIDTGADTQDLINVLKEALEFKKQIDSYFADEFPESFRVF